MVIDKRDHVAGNIYTKEEYGVNVHKYGAHIFHTSDEEVWEYVNNFCNFNNFINSPIANYKGEIYNLPFNMNTFNKMWGVITPEEAKEIIKEQKEKFKIYEPKNLEEQAINLVGHDIYEKLIKGYTEKQWGKDCKELPAFIIKRLPLRFTYNNNYFNDKYQGIPIGGYTQIIEKMLDGIDVELNCDFYEKYSDYERVADKLVFTGMIDEFFEHEYGMLEYRSLYFENEKIDISDYQGNAVVNYNEREVLFTRIIEHKHFEFIESQNTIITREYPKTWKYGDEAYYPINDEKNMNLLLKYKEMSKESTVIFGGRLGNYTYYDMDKVIRSALDLVKEELE